MFRAATNFYLCSQLIFSRLVDREICEFSSSLLNGAKMLKSILKEQNNVLSTFIIQKILKCIFFACNFGFN